MNPNIDPSIIYVAKTLSTFGMSFSFSPNPSLVFWVNLRSGNENNRMNDSKYIMNTKFMISNVPSERHFNLYLTFFILL